MKNAWVVGGIVAAHCVVIGALTLSGGCGTVGKQPPPPEQPVVMPLPPVEQPVAPVFVKPAKAEPSVPELTTKTYTVKSGDSLSLIAKRYHVSKADMMKLNKISDANKIHVGQKLKVPGYVDVSAAPAPEARKTHKAVAKPGKASPAAVAGGSEYVVVSGDTLGGIAHRHGTTVKALKQVNKLASDKVHVGQKLALPKGTAAAAHPGKSEVAPAPAPAPAPVEGTPGETAVAPAGTPEGVPPVPKSNEVLHVVEPNQDLSSIAMMYGVRAEEIIRLNNLASPDVKVGQTLKSPPPVE